MEKKSSRTRRTDPKKPLFVAVVNEDCTGCSGSPVCSDVCPVPGCMILEVAADAPTTRTMRVDPKLCIGCRRCASGGPEGILLTGCPWEAIELWPAAQYEARFGRAQVELPASEDGGHDPQGVARRA